MSASASILLDMQEERIAWMHALVYLKEETLFLKNILTERIKTPLDSVTLAIVENLQNDFIRQDELNELLRNYLASFEEMLNMPSMINEGGVNVVEIKAINIRTALKLIQQKFDRLKQSFNEYLKASPIIVEEGF